MSSTPITDLAKRMVSAVTEGTDEADVERRLAEIVATGDRKALQAILRHLEAVNYFDRTCGEPRPVLAPVAME